MEIYILFLLAYYIKKLYNNFKKMKLDRKITKK